MWLARHLQTGPSQPIYRCRFLTLLQEIVVPPGEKKWTTFYYIQYNFATCAHNRLFSTLLIGTDGKYRQHCSINKVLMSIGHIISYMFFLFTICSATRISWQNERIDVAPNTTTALLRRAFQKWASLRAVWWWRQKNKWRDWRKKVRASIRSLLNIASCKFHIRVYVS